MSVQPDIVGSIPRPENQHRIQQEKCNEIKIWEKVAEDNILGRIDRLTEGAKQIINITGFLLTTYFAAISFSSLNKYLIIRTVWDWNLWFILGPALFSLIGLGSAVWALDPGNHPLTDKIEDTKLFWNSRCGHINRYIWIARIFTLLAFGLMVFNMYCYILLICDP